ncbi:MAG: hypothetical protein AB8A39_01960, partial [Prochlorococcus sp.]
SIAGGCCWFPAASALGSTGPLNLFPWHERLRQGVAFKAAEFVLCGSAAALQAFRPLDMGVSKGLSGVSAIP